MRRLIERMKLVFVALFGLGAVGVWALHLLWIWPEKRCEAKGWWWDGGGRHCAMPIPLSTITGRIPNPSIYPSKPLDQ